jgi:hypothetical protein
MNEGLHIPLISSQRFLDRATVARKALTFKVFVVRTVAVELRGTWYRVLTDGHHNLAAARLAGIAPTWRGPSRKLQRVMREMGQARFAQMLINNLTDSDWYDVDTGIVVPELLGIERTAA